MKHAIGNPLLRPSAIFLVALSLSIGWGIRGNFGHESGAMIAGVLSATAIAILSRREDWRQRIPYFAMFGALGWGFGGSISYMYPFAFTESGHMASTYYGYFAIFLEGGLWCGLGAAGTALAATMPPGRLNRMFRPLCFVLVLMAIRYAIEPPLERFLAPPGAATGDKTWHRHESPLYWFDADWLPACMALVGVCLFDLYDRTRRNRSTGVTHPLMLLPLAGAGAVVGYAIQRAARAGGLETQIRNLLVVKLGDLNYVNPETGKGFDPDQLLTNWPQFFSDYPQYLGSGIGLLAGTAIYFAVAGKFRNDAKLFLYLGLGWLIGFLAMPTLGSIFLMPYGGLRLVPPRSDDWAGILGVFVAGLLWSNRHGLRPVAHVMSAGFLLGGMAFATVPMLRFVLRYPGHPWRFPNGVSPWLAHYQSANWHSIMEQLHGFGFGIAISIAMALLWRRQSEPRHARPFRNGTTAIAIWFAMFVVGYLNLHKLVETWVGNDSIPDSLKAPLFGALEAHPLTWFRIVWWTAGAVVAVLLAVHLRRGLEIVPSSWTGKGQLLYVLFLWMMVIGNLQRAIPGFSNGRMVTEWMLFMNASLATLLVVVLPQPTRPIEVQALRAAWDPLPRLWIKGLVVAGVLMSLYAYATLAMYQGDLDGQPWANHRRFGPEAKWRIDPILKHGEHP